MKQTFIESVNNHSHPELDALGLVQLLHDGPDLFSKHTLEGHLFHANDGLSRKSGDSDSRRSSVFFFRDSLSQKIHMAYEVS